MKHYLPPVFVFTASLLIATEALAVTFTLTPTVVGRFDDGFAPLAFEPTTTGPITAGSGIYQVDYNFTIDGLAANERGFANTLFDLNLTGGLQNMLGWNSMASGAGGQGPLLPPTYFVNTDAGQSASDLQRIITSIAPHLAASDARLTFGQHGASYLGSVFVEWDGASYAALSTHDITFSVVNSTGNFAVVPGTAAGSVIEFGAPADGASHVLPEPAFTPPPPPSVITGPVEPPPANPEPQPVTPPIVMNEPPPVPPEPELPQPEIPGEDPSVWVPDPPVTIQPIDVGATDPDPDADPIAGWPYSHMVPIDWDGEMRLLPYIDVDITDFDSGVHWIVDDSDARAFINFDGLTAGSAMFSMTDTLTSGAASAALSGQPAINGSPAPEPAIPPLIALALAGCSAFRRRR